MSLAPYYSDAVATIYCGDNREIVPQLSSRFDLLCTDPPYGIGADKNLRANKQHGAALAPSKDNGSNGYADCELAWTNLDKAVRLYRWRWMGMLQQDMSRKEVRVHPTQKPVAVMRWSLLQAPKEIKTVLDPYMGSGATLRAVKEVGGMTVVGIDKSERWCEESALKLSQSVLCFD